MLEALREWLGQIVCFLCLMTVFLHVIPENGMKRYIRFFLGILFLLVVLEPVGSLFGMEAFLMNFEQKSLMHLYQDYETGKMGLGDVLPEWKEEEYQRRLQQKVQEIYDTYHIPRQELHTNNQKAGAENGETGNHR